MWGNELLLGLIGLCSGGIVSAGLISFIVGLGVISDFADRTHTGASVGLYEDSIILGGSVANVFWLYRIQFSDALWLLVIFGLLAGIFVGCWAMALAEMLNVFPIFVRRAKIVRSIPYLILSIAIGKGLGLLWFFWNGW